MGLLTREKSFKRPIEAPQKNSGSIPDVGRSSGKQSNLNRRIIRRGGAGGRSIGLAASDTQVGIDVATNSQNELAVGPDRSPTTPGVVGPTRSGDPRVSTGRTTDREAHQRGDGDDVPDLRALAAARRSRRTRPGSPGRRPSRRTPLARTRRPPRRPGAPSWGRRGGPPRPRRLEVG